MTSSQQHQKPLWETFEATEREKHHFKNSVTARLKHVLESLRYASHLSSSLQRFDLALALVRAAETHISWLWEIEQQESYLYLMIPDQTQQKQREQEEDDILAATQTLPSSTSLQKREFGTILRQVTTAALKLRTLCESQLSLLSNSSSSTSSLWNKAFEKYSEKISRGMSDDLMMVILSSFGKTTTTHRSGHQQEDLCWLLSKITSNNFDRNDLEEFERGISEIFVEEEDEEDDNENGNYQDHQQIFNFEKSYAVKKIFFAQAFLVLGEHLNSSSSQSTNNNNTTTSAFHYFVRSLNEIRKVLHYFEEQKQQHRHHNEGHQQRQQQIEKIASSCVVQITRLILNNHQQQQKQRSTAMVVTNGAAEAEAFDEMKQIKQIQTMILLSEMISTLVKSFERYEENGEEEDGVLSSCLHSSSPVNDALMIDLYDCWAQLTTQIEVSVEKGFVKGRGQSRIRGRDFQLWLEKFRRKIRLEKSKNEEDYDGAKGENEEEENGTWFDVMQDRIRLLCIAREHF